MAWARAANNLTPLGVNGYKGTNIHTIIAFHLTLFHRWQSLSKVEKVTVGIWLLVAMLMVIKSIANPSGSTVSDEYLLGATRWLARDDLYSGPVGFLYLPQFAFLYSVYSPLPLWASEALWRITQLLVMLYGLVAFARLMKRPGENSFVPLLTVAVICISTASFRNGQANIMMLGLLLLSTVALVHKQWNRGALFMTLGLIVKPTFIVYYLLAGVLNRPLYWRLPVGLLVALLIPMLFQGSTYVLEQHQNFIVMLEEAVCYGESGEKLTWAHFFAIFPQVAGFSVAPVVQQLTRLVMALLTLVVAWYTSRKYPRDMAGYYIYALATCYLMLFNPRNETNDYALLSVAIGYWVAVSKHRFHDFKYHLFCWFFVVGFVASKYIVKLTPGMWAWWKPVMAVFFTIFLLQRLFSQAKNRSVNHTR
ncbi:MAG: glycosyltransferase family 87 protein [Candidatus Endonucleobacter bathymodioli]|uniref:Glycosyltransferase family 87 protein n=1 Tax=Candidatus Endonucleibacter bathymodioli TaxID=539814 RepID=A0AA90SYR4_9GAMM|nr:glycosyltransferase family 87 protein [Candidatus Endonucleobacter bathymodioli]